jgi:hypothetical protein
MKITHNKFGILKVHATCNDKCCARSLPEGYFKELKWFHHFKGFCGSLVTMLYGTELRTVSYRI